MDSKSRLFVLFLSIIDLGHSWENIGQEKGASSRTVNGWGTEYTRWILIPGSGNVCPTYPGRILGNKGDKKGQDEIRVRLPSNGLLSRVSTLLVHITG
jgi:hypothetical protein